MRSEAVSQRCRLAGPGSYDAGVTEAEDAFDALETPRCELHPLQRLTIAGDDPEGHDARWVCPVPGCSYSRIA